MSYPKVFLNLKNRSAPCVVRNAGEEAALDPAEWTPVPAANPPDAGMYPKLMYNINLPFKVVFDRSHEDALGDDWRQSPVVLPNEPPVELDRTGGSVGIVGGSGSFNVTITGYGKSNVWTATKDAYADWLTFTPTAPQGTDGTVNYTVAANTGGGHEQRTAHIYVNGKTFTIDQAGE